MNDERRQDMINVVTRIVNTTDGMSLLKYLRDDYLLKSPIDKSSIEMTYYRIGQQQLVKDGLKLIEDRERFARVAVFDKLNKRGISK